MPFTFAHPAIILPLHSLFKKWFSLTGLIVGSMAPDFEYFLRMKPKSVFSHTIEGIFYFDLPLGIIVAFIFHNVVRNSFIQNLPEFLNRRFSDLVRFNWTRYFIKNWFLVMVSLIIGAASHILWDSFTHESGYFVNKYSVLKISFNVHNLEIPVYTFLQHGSTFLGGLVILFYIMQLKCKQQFNSGRIMRYWLILMMIMFIVMVIRITAGIDLKLYGQIIVSIISAFFIGLIITPLYLKISDR